MDGYNAGRRIKDRLILGEAAAWLVTHDGNILKTADGGKEWKEVSGKKYGGFERIDFVDALHGWAITSSGKVLSTGDGGEIWSYLLTLDYSGEPFAGPFLKIQFLDEKIGWIVDLTSVWSTKDGGVSWKNAKLWKASDEIKEVAASFQAVSKDKAWIGAGRGTLYYTDDGGQSWMSKRIASRELDFNLIRFVGEKTGWAGVLASGILYHTGDGGLTWRLQNSLADVSDNAVLGIEFINETHGWAVGRNAVYDGRKLRTSTGPIFYTDNGGSTWNILETKLDEPFFNSIHIVNQQSHWLIGKNNVYRTADGGMSWVRVLSLESR
jgi:photosystem II stability/assembly factor-like uncharacterized protein